MKELITKHRKHNPDAYSEANRLGIAAYTLEKEYKRTIELFKEILASKGLIMALYLLADSGYTNEDLYNLITILENEQRRSTSNI